MARLKHETLAVAGSVVSPARTAAEIYAMGCAYVLVTSTQNVRFTLDGQTDPVITGTSEVGTLLGPTGDLTSIILTAEEYDDAKFLDVSTDARVQAEFLEGTRLRTL